LPYSKKSPAIPEKIRKEYRLTSLLSLHENAIVFSLDKKKSPSINKAHIVQPNPTQGVIKIMPRSYFDEDLFSTLQSLHHPLLLLPTELIVEEEYVYALYPRLLPLSEYLSMGKLPLSKLVQWIKDMSQILSCLHDKHIIHGDIAPGNIYLDDEGHFFLGDFSSGRIASSHHTMNTLMKKKNKTASTFPFTFSRRDCRQDVFSFLTILLKILEACSSSDNTAILSDLQGLIENLLAELEKKNSFSLNFREVCQKILSAIEEGKNEQDDSNQDLLLSPEKLDFLKEDTKPLKKKSKIFPPMIALAFCCVIFLSATIYYGRTSMPQQKKAVPPSNQFIQEETPASDIKGTDATTAPTEHISATSAPMASSAASATPAAKQQDYSILDISGRKYRNIASSPKTNSAVKIIFAQGNRMKKLSSFSIFPALEELYLDGNVISDLSNLSNLKHLAILGLSNNQVTDLSALESIPSLKILDLSGQKNLSHLSSLGRFKNLEYLILTDTNAKNHDIQNLQQSLPRCAILH
jgi:Leucine-rich repeat (LRR) protein